MNNTPMEQSYPDIYRLCFPKLVTYLQRNGACNHQDAEDTAARALHILWEKWDTMETHTAPGMLRWLLQTAKNLMRDETKKRSRGLQTVSLEDLTDHQLLQDLSEPLFGQDEADYDRYLTEILRRLPEKDAALFRAKMLERQSDAEISARLGISPGTLRVRWLRVKQKIRQMWSSLTADPHK